MQNDAEFCIALLHYNLHYHLHRILIECGSVKEDVPVRSGVQEAAMIESPGGLRARC
jgi:hypothetical protein